MGGAGASPSVGTLLGAFTFTYYKATAVVRSDATGATTGLVTEDLDGGDDRRLSTSLISARIKLPRTLAEFMNSLMIWIMICAATGLAHVLTTGGFLQDTVYDTINKLKRPWQVAHELFLLYLEKIETCEDGSYTLFSVYYAGGQDTLLARAKASARRLFGNDVGRAAGNGMIIQ